jgi:hypothetical protein
MNNIKIHLPTYSNSVDNSLTIIWMILPPNTNSALWHWYYLCLMENTVNGPQVIMQSHISALVWEGLSEQTNGHGFSNKLKAVIDQGLWICMGYKPCKSHLYHTCEINHFTQWLFPHSFHKLCGMHLVYMLCAQWVITLQYSLPFNHKCQNKYFQNQRLV